jgi:hypothetical protein
VLGAAKRERGTSDFAEKARARGGLRECSYNVFIATVQSVQSKISREEEISNDDFLLTASSQEHDGVGAYCGVSGAMRADG